MGPLENQALTKVYFVGAFSFAYNLPTFCQFPARCSVFKGKTGVIECKGVELFEPE